MKPRTFMLVILPFVVLGIALLVMGLERYTKPRTVNNNTAHAEVQKYGGGDAGCPIMKVCACESGGTFPDAPTFMY